MNLGIDCANVTYIIAQPERALLIKAGNGDWEVLFEKGDDGRIRGDCVRKGSLWRLIWDKAKDFIGLFVLKILIPLFSFIFRGV